MTSRQTGFLDGFNGELPNSTLLNKHEYIHGYSIGSELKDPIAACMDYKSFYDYTRLNIKYGLSISNLVVSRINYFDDPENTAQYPNLAMNKYAIY